MWNLGYFSILEGWKMDFYDSSSQLRFPFAEVVGE